MYITCTHELPTQQDSAKVVIIGALGTNATAPSTVDVPKLVERKKRVLNKHVRDTKKRKAIVIQVNNCLRIWVHMHFLPTNQHKYNPKSEHQKQNTENKSSMYLRWRRAQSACIPSAGPLR